MMDMETEIRLLVSLGAHPAIRSSKLAKVLNMKGREVRGLLEQLEKLGLAKHDLAEKWALTVRGEQSLEQMYGFIDAGVSVAKPDGQCEGASTPTPVPPDPVEDRVTRELLLALGPADRALVCAGPGMGKTHLACARISRLVAAGVEAHRILVISFSRAAVQVMRERSADDHTLDGVELRTLDSLGAMLHRERPTSGDYRASIERAVETRQRWGPGVRGVWSHVIVDESQDIIGARARLVCALLEEIASGERPAGFTILYDPAQAIYDFTRDDEDSSDLVECLRERELITSEQEHTLTVVHRSSRPELLELMARARPEVLDASDEARVRLGRLLDGATDRLEWDMNPSGELWLFRSRAEVADAIYRIHHAGVRCPIQLKMGGAGHELDPNIARILNACASWPHVSRGEWSESAGRVGVRGDRADTLFDALVGVARSGKELVDVRLVARSLARSGRPAPVFESPQEPNALTLGVVHAAKGTEADSVRYFRIRGRSIDAPEEARVAHVAISRARETLSIHDRLSRATRANHKGSREREWFRVGPKKTLRMLICGPVDVDEHENLGIYLDEDDGIQGRLAGFGGAPEPVEARFDGRRYVLSTAEGACVGALSELVCSDLEHHFGDSFSSHGGLGGLHWIGVRAVFKSPDLSASGPLRSPFHRTRVWLTPVVAGLAAPYRLDPETQPQQ